jgi:isopenicillin-N N-acyltransferase-like protein
VLLRALLAGCDTLEAAVELLLCAEVAASSCVNLAQAGPDGPAVAAVELAPGGSRVLRPGPEGWLAHANHFRLPPAGGADSYAERFPDTIAREQRVAAALAAARPAPGAADLLDVLRSHDDGALSVCCHDVENPTYLDRHGTLASVLMDLSEPALLVSDGPPCVAPLEPVPLPT